MSDRRLTLLAATRQHEVVPRPDEIEFELVATGDDELNADETSRPGLALRWVPLAVGAALIVGFLAGSVRDSEVGSDPAPLPLATVTSPPPTQPVVPSTGPSTSRPPAPVVTSPRVPALSLTADAGSLTASLVVVPWASPDAEGAPIWVIDSGRATSSFTLNPRRGNDRFPLLFSGSRILFMGPVAPVVVTSDLAGSESLPLSQSVFYLVAGASAGTDWAVDFRDGGSSNITRLDGGEANDTFTIEGLRWITAGVADGVIGLESGLSSTAGTVAYWTQDRGTRRLESVADTNAAILATNGDLVAIFETGPRISVVDVRNDVEVVGLPVLNHPTHACFSPDGRYLAITQGPPNANVVFLDLAEPSRTLSFTSDPVRDITWLADHQFVVAYDSGVLAVDVDTMTGASIAELSGATGWWVASDVSNC